MAPRFALSWVALVLVLGAGCAKEKAVANLPALETPAPPALPGPSEPAPPPPVEEPPTPTPLVVPPAGVPAPPRAVVPPRPVSPPPPPAAVPPPAPVVPPPMLSPEIGTEEQRRLTREAQARIAGAERLVARLDRDKLGRQQQETFSTIQSFLVKAREAMTERDYPRALVLADKARVLAEELSQKPR
ncbi:MAG TPA: hypothetical protein VML54_03430 [Candidatus Limnocylindrales bacterium]|nr:hypothetical protein [Candidatus Limnocylindrales bacterium]